MLDRIKKVLDLNNIAYESGESRMYIKLGGLSSKVKVTYDYATNTYKFSCGELLLSIQSMGLFCLAFNGLNELDSAMWPGYASGLMFALAIGNLFTLISTKIQMLDIRAQLRQEGIYLKYGS
ncbi:hypothetical protein EGH82_09860 [Vibrio ponticus]|uniref:Uncharacterized protein n=1 Tax=Vibrio ponticus TaxID=265668 RepID=A0A3N3E0Q8_9VIBR|nr:hypothetical protein [Vibrio ponticus]ROV60331.1 hypothetical protein EGH82_09860 [Vibrio ponticus]